MESAITVEARQNTFLPWRMNSSFILVWTVEGQTVLHTKRGAVALSPDQMYMVHPYEGYSVEQGEYSALFLTIRTAMLPRDAAALLPDRYLVYAQECDDAPHRQLRKDIVSFLDAQAGLMQYADMYRILYDLSAFGVDEAPPESRTTQEKLSLILSYLDTHYRESITLETLSRQFYLSPQYITRLFREYAGDTFLHTLTRIRLSHAVWLLTSENTSQEEISASCGFPSVKSFAAAFRKQYGTLPGEYRKRHPAEKTPSAVLSSVLDQYRRRSPDSVLSALRPESRFLDPVPLTAEGSAFTMPFPDTVVTERASWLLFRTNQDLLSRVHREIGCRYALIESVFAEDMHLLHTDYEGHVSCSFAFADSVLDFLASIGVLPFIRLSRADFGARSAELPLAFPEILRQFLAHVQYRYGADVLASWRFCIDIPFAPGIDLDASYPAFFEDYHRLYDTIRSFDPRIQIGSPVFMSDAISEDGFLSRFAADAAQSRQIPDFMCCSLYPVSMKDNQDIFSRHGRPVPLTDPSSLKKQLEMMHAVLARYQLPEAVRVLYWNYTLGHDPLNDTLYRSVYLLRTVLECRALAEFSLCKVSDFADITGQREEFGGGYGYITGSGICKPVYHAASFLKRLGNRLLASGDGYIITKSSERLVILLYYFVQFSEQYAKEGLESDSSRSLQPFAPRAPLKISLPIELGEVRSFSLRESILSGTSGSAYDQWVLAGRLPLNSPEMIFYLQSTSIPLTYIRRETADSSRYLLQRELYPLECRFIEIGPAKST